MINRILFSTLIFILSSQTSFAQNKVEQLDSLFTALFESGKFNGNVLIAEKGIPIYQKSFGFENEESKAVLTTNSIFELQSLSKQFTAMAIVLLKEHGKLKYDAPITNYFPELSFYKNITIRNLLNHTNGLPDYYEEPLSNYFDKTKIATNKDVLEFLVKQHPPVLFESNTAYKYSQTGYALLGIIVEKVSKDTYANFLQNNIFKPLGMKNTMVYNRRQNAGNIKHYAYGYVQDSLHTYVWPDALKATQRSVYFDGIIGGRGVHSTTSDLLLWDRALRSDILISATALNDIYSPAILKNNEKSTYGFGWRIENWEEYGKVARHSGGDNGYATVIERHLSNDKTIIILQNHDWDYIIMPTEQIRKILY